MNINQNANYNKYPISQQSFTSKNKMLREIDDIARLALREFPMHSDTKMYAKDKRDESTWKVCQYVGGIISEIRGYMEQNPALEKSTMILLDAAKNVKMGNCKEYAGIASIACRINGYKDAKVYQLMAYNPETGATRDLGHALVGIGMKKNSKIKKNDLCKELYFPDRKSIVVDNWLGVVDYEKNINYRKQDFIYKNVTGKEIICYALTGKVNSLQGRDLIFIEKQYPNLSKSKKMGFLKNLRYKFMKKDKYSFTPFDTCITESYKRNLKFKKALTSAELTNILTTNARRNESCGNPYYVEYMDYID